MKDYRPAYALVVRCGCAGGGKGALVQTDVCNTVSTNITPLYVFVPKDGDDGGDEYGVDAG